jgi:hypothetical protein
VREDCDTRHQYRSEVGDQRRPVTSGDLVLLGGDVPDAGGYQNGKGGLGDLVEPAGRSTRHLGSGRRSTGASAASVSWPPNQMVAVQDSLSVSELTVSIPAAVASAWASWAGCRPRWRCLGGALSRKCVVPAGWPIGPGDPVRLENRIRQVTGRCSVSQAACVYSLIRPLRTGFRRICCVPKSVTVARGPSRSSSGTCCAMP